MEKSLTLKEHVYDYIAEQISSGRLVPGEKINENSISDKLNISITPVREALFQLSAEGLLKKVPRKGFEIKHLYLEEAKETYLIIGVLDGVAVSLACPYISEQSIKDMEFYIKSMDIALESENFSMYYKLQEEFHNVYLSLCPNKSLVNLLVQLKKKFMKKTYEPEPQINLKEILLVTNNEHREIVRLIKAKNIGGLEKYLREVHWNVLKAHTQAL